MGVPKFYRWISERYPCLSEVVKEYQIPEFDNLYLDMNGIIHPCSHPNDDDPHFRITEEKIFQDIFHYIEVLFRMIQPRKVFFMAVDGVAPRAKMNQQRGRRFRSAKEAELNEKKAKDRGETLPSEERFDSNCITPGTVFMTRLHEQLKYFVVNKLSTDPLWKGTKVILSGHETPGEGEHKIMDFIRHEKSKPGYDANTRHCLYGLDADLIMLGLVTHDPHFSLLREEVKFGGKKGNSAKRTPTPEETTFHLLHLSLMREYLDYEFQDLKHLDFYDVEGIIDDWVLMGFLVGNDFIPHLPHLHINKGALPDIFSTYKKVLPSLGGFLNEGGSLNLHRFEKFMNALAKYELERFDEIYSDDKWLEGKTAKRSGGVSKVESTPGPGHVYEILEGAKEPGINFAAQDVRRNSDLARLMASTAEFDSTDEEEEGVGSFADNERRGDFYQMEFRQHKRDYYIHKLGYSQVNDQVLREQAECYVRAIQWNLHYYYNGCMSWSWFYPHHYSPWISDITGFTGMDLSLELSKPFLPFEQLLAVLPAASGIKMLPNCFGNLMTSTNSPIIEYYPTEFEQDLNGKQQEWEAVVCVPFIDEKRLLEAMTPLYDKLSPAEKARNNHGPMVIYSFSEIQGERYEAPDYFPPIEKNFTKVEAVLRSEWDLPVSKLRKGLLPGAKLDVYFPGFPTLMHICHTAKLSKQSVRVFEQSSRGENMMLCLEERKDTPRPDINDVASELMGKEVWVGWPHLVEAKVVGVSNSRTHQGEAGANTGGFPIQCRGIQHRYKDRFGVEVGETQVLVHACQMSGRQFVFGNKGRISLEKQWAKISQPFALQTIVRDIAVHDPGFKHYTSLDELFSQGTTCFMLGTPYYGSQGWVLQIDPQHKGRIQLRFLVPAEPELQEVARQQERNRTPYVPGYNAAQQLGISSHILSRITGSIFVMLGAREQQPDTASKANIGLNLKFNKRNEEVAGFTKKAEDNTWLYSSACINVLKVYQEKFPEVFDYLSVSGNANSDLFHELDVFGGCDRANEKVKELQAWIAELPIASAPRQPFGTQSLDEAVIKAAEEAADVARTSTKKEVIIQVRPHLLFLPNQFQGNSLPDRDTNFRLMHRVVNVREGFSVPLGLRGTLIGIQKAAKTEDILYDVVFDEPFAGGLPLRCTPGKGYRLPGSALINLNQKDEKPIELRQNGGNRSVHHENGGRGRGNRGRGNANPWNRGNMGRSGQQQGHQQQQQKDEALMFPPPAHNLPKPPQFMQEGQGGNFQRGPQYDTEGRNFHPPNNRGRGKVKILQRPEQVARYLGEEESESMKPQDIWASLQQGGGSSTEQGHHSEQKEVKTQGEPRKHDKSSEDQRDQPSAQEMSNSLKQMLNISGPPSSSSVQDFFQSASGAQDKNNQEQSHCRELADSLGQQGLGVPRYNYINCPKTGRVEAQVTLADGRMFHSSPCDSKVDASEGAAKFALKAVMENKGGQGGRGNKGRGRGQQQFRDPSWGSNPGWGAQGHNRNWGNDGNWGGNQGNQGWGGQQEGNQGWRGRQDNNYGYQNQGNGQYNQGYANQQQDGSVPGFGCASNHGGYGNHDSENGGNNRNSSSGSYGSQDIPFVPLQVSRKATKQTPTKKAEEHDSVVEESTAPVMRGVEENLNVPVPGGGVGRGRAREKSETPQREGRRKPRIAANFSVPQ